MAGNAETVFSWRSLIRPNSTDERHVLKNVMLENLVIIETKRQEIYYREGNENENTKALGPAKPQTVIGDGQLAPPISPTLQPISDQNLN